jgi:septum formation protein
VPLPGESAEELVLRLAEAKARRIADIRTGAVVIGADTVVVVDGEILGKPAGAEEAKVLLRKVSGRRHEVLTGVVVLWRDGGVRKAGIERSVVRAAPLSEEEIGAYVATGEPIGKAGGYAIQGAGARFLELEAGSRTNVIGLPLELVSRFLSEVPGLTPARPPFFA